MKIQDKTEVQSLSDLPLYRKFNRTDIACQSQQAGLIRLSLCRSLIDTSKS